jgi:hypothetical protein
VKEKNALSVPEIKRRFHGRLTRRTITTGLSGLHNSQVCAGVVKGHSPKCDSEFLQYC